MMEPIPELPASGELDEPAMIGTVTARGLHEFVASQVFSRYARPGARAVDLGAGPGAMCERFSSLGCQVLSVDRDQADFASPLGVASFDLVVAVEVIEHFESPINFLRSIARLLSLDGVAVIATPNVDSLPARLKFLLKGSLRMMDKGSDPAHNSPTFSDLLHRQFLPRAGLQLREHPLFRQRATS